MQRNDIHMSETRYVKENVELLCSITLAGELSTLVSEWPKWVEKVWIMLEHKLS